MAIARNKKNRIQASEQARKEGANRNSQVARCVQVKVPVIHSPVKTKHDVVYFAFANTIKHTPQVAINKNSCIDRKRKDLQFLDCL